MNHITHLIIGGSIRIHRKVGPGLLESAYHPCFAWELKQMGLQFAMQHPVPLIYADVRLERTHRLDFFVEGLVIVELKAVESLGPIHRAQMLTYLRLTGCHVGLVLNFCAPLMHEGIMRVANNFPDLEDPENDDRESTETAEAQRCSEIQAGIRSRISASLRLRGCLIE